MVRGLGRRAVPADRAGLILGLSEAPRSPSLISPLAYLGLRRHRAPNVSRSPWLRRHWGVFGISAAATAAAASGQDRGPAVHHARPGTAGNDSKGGGELRGRSRLARLVACGFGVAGRPVSVGSGRDPAPRPAPAQSPPRPNPIVPPGLGLASPLARTKLDAGRATPAVPGT